MKLNVMHLVLISLTLTGVISPITVYSGSSTSTEANLTTDNLTNKHNVPNANQTTLNTPTRKDILIDDSRGLSAFFILGIVINIIMAVTFAWWFSKEWRKSKK